MAVLKNIFLAVLSGGLLVLCFPYPDQGWLVFFALTPLLFITYVEPPGRSFLYGWLAGSVFFGGVCYWVAIYGALSFIIMALTFGLFVAAFAGLVSFLAVRLRPVSRLLTIPALWIALEAVRSEGGLFSYPFGGLGYALHGLKPALGVASLGGVYLVSYVIVLANAGFAEVVRAVKEKEKNKALRFGAAAAVILVIAAAAGLGASTRRDGSDESRFTVAIIQASIPQDEKWLVSKRAEIMDSYEKLVRHAARGSPDLIVLPEAALPAYVTDSSPLVRRLAGWARETDIPILAGVPLMEDGRAINTATLYDRHGRKIGRYAKMIPALFGEYVPFRPLSEAVYPRLADIGDITPGSEQTVFSADLGGDGPVDFGTLICSESLYERLMNGLAEKNVTAVFVLTNDAWFYSTAEAEQHFNMTKMRAAETGKPVVQAANTGISGFIDSYGETAGTIRLNRVGTIQNTVTGNRRRTIYTRFGRFLPIIIVLVTAILITVLRLVHICTRRRRAGIIKAKNLNVASRQKIAHRLGYGRYA
ncbi:MAG: apolipoprotein N-acyltransferase [Actinomycetota bacterium]